MKPKGIIKNQYNKIVLLLVLILMVKMSYGQDYPFTFPSTITASLNVDTNNTEPFNNKLIGYNIQKAYIF